MTTTGTALCPSGDVVIGGGVSESSGALLASSSLPVDILGTFAWSVTVGNTNSAGANFTVYGICIPGTATGLY